MRADIKISGLSDFASLVDEGTGISGEDQFYIQNPQYAKESTQSAMPSPTAKPKPKKPSPRKVNLKWGRR